MPAEWSGSIVVPSQCHIHLLEVSSILGLVREGGIEGLFEYRPHKRSFVSSKNISDNVFTRQDYRHK